MHLLKPLAKIIGPKGLMPTPKLKTQVSLEGLRDAIRNARNSLVEFM